MSCKLTAVVDADGIRYSVAAAGEKRSVIVSHKTTNKQLEVDNRTAFYGRTKNKDGGILAELNSLRDSPYTWDEFTYEDKQTPEPVENVLHSAKLTYNRWLETLGTDKHKGFLGKGENFRVARSTLLKYKGNRENNITPIHLKEVDHYLHKKFNCEYVEYIETDDACIIEAYKKRDHVVLSQDKDCWAQPVLFLSMTKPEEGIVDCDCFGKLWLDEKGDVRGIGRMYLYWQTMSNDRSDNYAANCFSDVRWGDKAAYNILKDCQNDKEAFESLVRGFKILYPEPKIIEGCKGDVFEINWLYVFQECFTMARMLRTEDEKEIQVVDILNKLGVNY